MRLINTTTLELEEFPFDDKPSYAILSHTWSDSEVSYLDMLSEGRESRAGWSKIVQTCELALCEYDLQYAWVDTCCIDKSSSAELTEAINSMFAWYRNARVCFAYLADLEPDVEFVDSLASARWWTRGWTLQELIAPTELLFYDRDWTLRGSRSTLVRHISLRTGISMNILLRKEKLDDTSVATRMSWAAGRSVSRTEDKAYCLLGIFGINMPMIYGEGASSFRRLQEEIVKQTNDFTIFAHTKSHLFASSPDDFSSSGQAGRSAGTLLDFSITNQGLRVAGDIFLHFGEFTTDLSSKAEVKGYAVELGYNLDDEREAITMGLHKLGPGMFARSARFPVCGLGSCTFHSTLRFRAADFYILHKRDSYSLAMFNSYRKWAIHVRLPQGVALHKAEPRRLWDATESIFLRLRPQTDPFMTMVIAVWLRIDNKFEVLILCDHRHLHPRCKLLELRGQMEIPTTLFLSHEPEKYVYWVEFEDKYAKILSRLTSELVITRDSRSYVLAATVQQDEVHRLWHLSLDVHRHP